MDAKCVSTDKIEDYQKHIEMLNGNNLNTPNLNYESDHVNLETPDKSSEAIADFYEDSVVLVTGGTGFVGKALLEKLLRSCPGIKTIYILMRPKRGLTVEQRYKELLKHQVFDRIRARWPERLGKLYPITGDVSAPNLGVSVEQRALLAKVTTLFHSAATVRFTEPLHAATTLNVQGTASLLKLAEDMHKLKALVHVSTAYSNAPRSLIEERVYPPPYDPDSIVRCTKMLPPETVEVISETLQGEHPNPYTLTKALAESIVYSHTNLPVCIVRPSIVTAALQEPFPGWIDNIYGVTGLIMEISRGTYRSGYCRERYVVDLVPVDMVVNSCILAAWRQGVKQSARSLPGLQRDVRIHQPAPMGPVHQALHQMGARKSHQIRDVVPELLVHGVSLHEHVLGDHVPLPAGLHVRPAAARAGQEGHHDEAGAALQDGGGDGRVLRQPRVAVRRELAGGAARGGGGRARRRRLPALAGRPRLGLLHRRLHVRHPPVHPQGHGRLAARRQDQAEETVLGAQAVPGGHRLLPVPVPGGARAVGHPPRTFVPLNGRCILSITCSAGQHTRAPI